MWLRAAGSQVQVVQREQKKKQKKTEEGKIETECGGEREKTEVSGVRSFVSELVHT